jgi:hypothetical protein
VLLPATAQAVAWRPYKGKISKFGVDIGYLNSAVLVWAVLAPTADAITPAALRGDYIGATGSATVGVGAGANVLVGGMHNSFTLQPVSIEGNTGLNVAAGVAALKLEPTDSISKKRDQS